MMDIYLLIVDIFNLEWITVFLKWFLIALEWIIANN